MYHYVHNILIAFTDDMVNPPQAYMKDTMDDLLHMHD